MRELYGMIIELVFIHARLYVKNLGKRQRIKDVICVTENQTKFHPIS